MSKKDLKKKSMKQRLKEKREELKRKSSGSSIIRQKDEGTMRVRILPTGEDNDFVQEIIQFWLGQELKGLISPATFGEPCAVMESYQELKDSDDEDDKDLAKGMMPKNRYVIPVLVYADDKGKKINTELSGKLLQITNGLYQSIIDLYLDDDEWGDMTDPKKGYDLKITRDGKGMTDTTYTVQPCKNTPIAKEYRKPIALEELVRKDIPTYEETVAIRNSYLNGSGEEEEKTKKSKKKKKSSKEKEGPVKKRKVVKKKRSKDI